MPQNSGINKIFFQDFFDKCPVLGWLLLKPLLKCFLSEKKTDKDSKKDVDMKEEGEKKEEGKKQQKKKDSDIHSVH
jgi:hypothetical protein